MIDYQIIIIFKYSEVDDERCWLILHLVTTTFIQLISMLKHLPFLFVPHSIVCSIVSSFVCLPLHISYQLPYHLSSQLSSTSSTIIYLMVMFHKPSFLYVFANLPSIYVMIFDNIQSFFFTSR